MFAVTPPSNKLTFPLLYAPARDARYNAVPTISSSVPNRSSGMNWRSSLLGSSADHLDTRFINGIDNFEGNTAVSQICSHEDVLIRTAWRKIVDTDSKFCKMGCQPLRQMCNAGFADAISD